MKAEDRGEESLRNNVRVKEICLYTLCMCVRKDENETESWEHWLVGFLSHMESRGSTPIRLPAIGRF